MYRVAICEDEKPIQNELVDACGRILRELDVEYELVPFDSTETLWARLTRGERFDLLCLDILMPGRNGLEMAQELRLRDDRTSILFITGSTEFLQDGYSVQPVQYLIKPVDETLLKQALQTDLRRNHQPQTIVLQGGGSTTVLPLRDIFYVEGRDHGVYITSTRGQSFFRINLEQLIQMLPMEQFCQCHRSFVVNLQHIRDISNREVTLESGAQIPVSRGQLAQFRQQFNVFLNAGRQPPR